MVEIHAVFNTARYSKRVVQCPEWRRGGGGKLRKEERRRVRINNLGGFTYFYIV